MRKSNTLLLLILGSHALLLLFLCGNTNHPSLYLTPREGNFLLGILFSPLIHFDWGHLTGNIQLMVPCFLIFYFIVKEKTIILYCSLYLTSSVLLWLIGRSGIHIGISGVVISIVFFIICSGPFSYNRTFIIVSLFVAAWQIILLQNFWKEYDGVSSDAHFIGAFVGILAAYLYWRPFKGFFWV